MAGGTIWYSHDDVMGQDNSQISFHAGRYDPYNQAVATWSPADSRLGFIWKSFCTDPLVTPAPFFIELAVPLWSVAGLSSFGAVVALWKSWPRQGQGFEILPRRIA
jgi:hypothetical protein